MAKLSQKKNWQNLVELKLLTKSPNIFNFLLEKKTINFFRHKDHETLRVRYLHRTTMVTHQKAREC
jgi:hypothetical protein